MKTDLSLVQLAKELERQQASKRDYVVDTRKIVMDNEKSDLHFKNGEDHDFEVNEVAHKQIAARLEIPAKYYDKMRRETPELLARNVNHWFQRKPENRMVRTLDGRVRAFLSDRYQRIENFDIANVAIPALAERSDMEIVSTSITETRLYIKAVFHKVQREVKVGDVVEAGVVISNSEVGLGAVKVEPMVNRLVCSNGLIVNDARFMARHLGVRVAETDNIRGMLTDETVKSADKTLMLELRDVINASFNEDNFEQYVQRMQGAVENKIVGNPAESVKLLAKKQSFTEFETGGVLRHLIEGGDLSQWGLLNAVTRTAQDVKSYDRATELETLGGTMLMMPSNEWRALAEAA